MKIPLWSLLVALGLLSGCGKKEEAKTKNQDSSAGGVSAATAPLDYLAAQGRARQTALKVTSMAEVNQAIQKFHALEDRFPRDLNELVQQNYLGSLPPIPNGTQLAYDPRTGTARFVRAVPGTPATPSAAPAGRSLPGIKNLPGNATPR